MGMSRGVWLLVVACGLAGQTFDNQTVSGKYYFRHVLYTTDAAENITGIRSLSGAITFDGAGNFTFTGQQTVGANPPAALSGSGTYSVTSAGIVTLTNPQDSTLTLNARYGVAGGTEAMLVGSSTEGAASTFDLFVAVEAPGGMTSNASLSGNYFVSTLAFPPGGTTPAAMVRNCLFSLSANGQGGFGDINVSGHAANLSSGAVITQAVTGATYSMQADGSG